MSLHNPSLESQLHELFISQGEISAASDIARLVLDFEEFHGVSVSDSDLLKATRAAGESFVDSMVQNEHDTELEGYTDLAPLEDRIAHWEAQRPSTVRRKQIEALLSNPPAGAPQIEIIKGLYSSLAWHIDNHGAVAMDQHRMDQARAVILSTK